MSRIEEIDEVWKYIHAKRYEDAERVQRGLIARTDVDEHDRLRAMYGLLASILHSLERHDEAGEAHRRAYEHAVLSKNSVNSYRYALANYYTNFGQPHAALEVIGDVESGESSGQCLIHLTKAKVLLALGLRDDALRAAEVAYATAPEEHRQEVGETLEAISKGS